MESILLQSFREELNQLESEHNLRSLPHVIHDGRNVISGGKRMLNLSSNDYLGIAVDIGLREEFMSSLTLSNFIPTASSSRLLTGNYSVYAEVESLLSCLYGTEAALVFNSGYHMNAGILPAICDNDTLILADKLVHASLIDGIRLSSSRFIRYRHNDYDQLEKLIQANRKEYGKIIIVTESLFSMDGDEADLDRLKELKRRYENVLLYVDEAHAVGVRGERGLGCAEEKGCIGDIDFLTGTFGKAFASVGGYIVCRKVITDYLVNKMRTLIFTTGLPPVNLMWTRFILERLDEFKDRREHLHRIGIALREGLERKGFNCPSSSHIIPVITGDSAGAVSKAEEMQRKGFYMLPVRPPTVTEGSSRIRISLSAAISEHEIQQIIKAL